MLLNMAYYIYFKRKIPMVKIFFRFPANGVLCHIFPRACWNNCCPITGTAAAVGAVGGGGGAYFFLFCFVVVVAWAVEDQLTLGLGWKLSVVFVSCLVSGWLFAFDR